MEAEGLRARVAQLEEELGNAKAEGQAKDIDHEQQAQVGWARALLPFCAAIAAVCCCCSTRYYARTKACIFVSSAI